MDRERTMQRLNLFALGAFLLGLAAFVYDVSKPAPEALVMEASADSTPFAPTAP